MSNDGYGNSILVTVAQNRRLTLSNSGTEVVYEGGMQTYIGANEVKRLVNEGVIIPPGDEYSYSAGLAYPAPPSTRQNYGCQVANDGDRSFTLPSTPADPAGLLLNIDGRDYTAASFTVSGNTVTMTFPLRTSDRIVVNYR